MTLKYIAPHDGQPHYHRKHIFLVAATMGLVVGMIVGVMVRTVRDGMTTDHAWRESALVCTASVHEDGRHVYFMRNNGPDFHLSSATNVYGVDPRGLVPAAGRLEPVAIPQGTTVAVTIVGAYRAYVMLDTATRRRIEFR